MKKRKNWILIPLVLLFLFHAVWLFSENKDLLGKLGQKQNFRSKRISSYDRTGGNRDSLLIEPGRTAVLADIKEPGAIHHIWMTIAAEAFYGRKIILRMYWDGEEVPSVEAPIGDFFGVGHGLNRNFSSLPINCSSEGRARNCYWYMPFRQSARVTATNEGREPVDAFYYYIDYRELRDVPADIPYFHAWYRQEMPCEPGKNYLILDAAGSGHYVGCNLSILQRAMGWWGEGDDMIYVDGEAGPSLHGTGSEDYFSDAWGMRQDENLFYGCPLQEEDFQVGSKATVYRFHIPDPIPFEKSIKVTIEHGHANDRSDFFSSVAYWYQNEPHRPFPPLPGVNARLPFAFEAPENFTLPRWEGVPAETGSVFVAKNSGLKFKAEKLIHSLTSYYGPNGSRLPVLMTEKAGLGSRTELVIPIEIGERYNLNLYFLKGPSMGIFRATEIVACERSTPLESPVFEGFSPEKEIATLSLKNVLLQPGLNSVLLEVTGKSPKSAGMDLGFVGISLAPSSRRFITEWNLIGPFDAPDMDYLLTAYPPEREVSFAKKYPGKGNKEIAWEKIQAEKSGYVRLSELIKPNEQAIAYGLSYLFSPQARETFLLLGSDDGVRVWLNDELIHTNPAYRGAYPDEDRIKVNLRKGWNKVLIKVLQGGGGWGYYLRFVDPDSEFRWSVEPEK